MASFRQGESPTAAYEHLGAQLLQSTPNGNSGGDIFLRAGWAIGGGPGAGTNPRPFRTVLSFDLSAIPSGSTITAASLQLTFAGDDTNPINGLELYRVVPGANMIEGTGLQATPTIDGVTWSNIRPGVPWTNPGGDFQPAILSSIGQDADGGAAGEVYSFNTSAGFIASAQSALDSQLPLELLIRSAAAEAGGGAQNFFRFASDDYPDVSLRPNLIVEYAIVPEPGALVLTVFAAAFGSFVRRPDRCQ